MHRRMVGRRFGWLLAFTGLVVLGVAASARAQSINIWWHTVQNSTATVQDVRVITRRPRTYWAHVIYLAPNSGGYMGLQTDGIRADGSIGDMALFSMWDVTEAIAAPGATCIPFGGEGTGMSCRMPYAWQTNRTYRYRMYQVPWPGQPGRAAMDASIQDLTTGVVTKLGTLPLPPNRSWITGRASFVEYFGPTADCLTLPRTESIFFMPYPSPFPDRLLDVSAPAPCFDQGYTFFTDGKPIVDGATPYSGVALAFPGSRPVAPPPPPPPAPALLPSPAVVRPTVVPPAPAPVTRYPSHVRVISEFARLAPGARHVTLKVRCHPGTKREPCRSTSLRIAFGAKTLRVLRPAMRVREQRTIRIPVSARIRAQVQRMRRPMLSVAVTQPGFQQYVTKRRIRVR